MREMGYRNGQGLGKNLRGITCPVDNLQYRPESLQMFNQLAHYRFTRIDYVYIRIRVTAICPIALT